jgi:hypothetical protein
MVVFRLLGEGKRSALRRRFPSAASMGLYMGGALSYGPIGGYLMAHLVTGAAFSSEQKAAGI